MQAVILAAGEGKRLWPLTEDRPKPMVLVGGRPILEHALETLPEEIDEIILVVGYKQEKIKEYFGDEWQGRRLTYVHQPEPKGTGEALERARPLLREGRFLIMYADDLYHPQDVRDCVQNEDLALLAKETKHPERMGVCITDESGFLQELIEKSDTPPTNVATFGIYVLDHSIFDVQKVFDAKSEHILAPQIGILAKQVPVKVLKARFWHPIGYPEDIEAAEKYVSIPPDQRRN